MRYLILFLLMTQTVVMQLHSQAAKPPAEAAGASGSAAQDVRGRGDRGPARSLTIEQALTLAEQNSPLLGQANASVSQAKAAILSAKAYTNPSVDVAQGHQSDRPIATPGVPGPIQQYGVSQTLEIPVERRTRITSAELDLKSTDYRLAMVRMSLSANVKRAFYDVVRRKEQLEIARNNLTLVEDLRHRIQLQVEVGEMGRLELIRAEAEMARAAAAVRGADAQVASARAMFKAVLGAQIRETFDAEGSLGDKVQIGPLNELRRQIMENHPSLADVNTQTERARVMVRNEQAKRIPMPTFTTEYERQPDLSLFRFGVSVPVPLWDKRRGPIAEAAANVTRTEAVARQRVLEITAALERAYDQYQISSQQVEGLEAGTLRGAEAAVEAARAAFKYGERGIVEVLDAQRVLQGVRNDLLDALYARRSALIDLEELGVTHP